MAENKYFPALPNYTGSNSGMAGLVHHDRLYEYCWSFKERIEAIRRKPANEIATRERCLVYLDPTGRAWEAEAKALIQAVAAFKQAQQANFQAWTGLDRAWTAYYWATKTHKQAWMTYDQAKTACDQATIAYSRAQAAFYHLEMDLDCYASQIETQIRELVLDLPWDGTQLVFPKM